MASNSAPNKAKKVFPKKRNSRWAPQEVRVLLRVLREHGHKNIEKIAPFIPTRTKSEIASYLRRHQRTASEKFRAKNRLQIQDWFDGVHPWMSFINVHCPSDVESHDPVVAHILPVLEKYANRPSAEFGNVNFKVAYRALFNALTQQKFPDELNEETFSMIYASLHALHDEIRLNMSKDEKFKDVLKQCIQRRFAQNHSRKTIKKSENDTLMLPQVNVLQLNSEELNELCDV